jgi:glycosyltransferase involved in cell wall biosynthesis
MHQRKNVLVIYIDRSSFVKQDIDALSYYCNVIEYSFGSQKGINQIFAQLKLFYFLIINSGKYNTIYCWFADYHCLLPSLIKKFTNKKLIVAIGGFDAIAIPEYHYGAHLKRIRSRIIRFCCDRADLLICSSKFVGDCLKSTLQNEQLEKKIVVAYPGIACAKANLKEEEEEGKTYFAIYVSAGSSIDRMLIKGVDRFLELAKSVPEKKFILIGPQKEAFDWVKSQNIPNLELVEKLKREEITSYYSKSKYIALFSRFEAFGMVILEGMCNGCIPVCMVNSGTAEILSFKDSPGITLTEFNIKYLMLEMESKEHDHLFTTKNTPEAIGKYLKANFPINLRSNNIIDLINN